jgi:hypothetical protein
MLKKMMNMLLTVLFTSIAFSACPEPSVPFKHQRTAHNFLPEKLSIIARVSVALFARFAQNLMLLLCRMHCEIASGQIQDSK